MTKKRSEKAGKLPVDDIDGGTALVADEDAFDRRRLSWRLTSWGVAATGAVIIAILANQSSITLRRDQAATAELARQTQQIRALARQNHTEADRLASAIEALDGDRNQLDARVAVLEQGLASVTGSIARQAREQKPKETSLASPVTAPSSLPTAASDLPRHEAAAAAAVQPAQPAPVIAAPATSATAAPPATAAAPSDSSPPASTSSARSKTSSNTPDATASVAISETKVMASDQAATADVASTSPAPPSAPVQRTEFGVDLGSANSIGGLRALWRGVMRAHSKEVGSLEPIIVIKERTNGLGMRLHLVAGPLSDAAAAAKICAALAERKRSCETSVYDGQRLALGDSKQSAGESAIAKPQAAHRTVSRHKRNNRLTRLEQPLPAPPPPPDPAPSRSRSFFSR